MKMNEWFNFFKKYQTIKVFHINHIKVLTGLTEEHVRTSLSRLTKRQWLLRICRNYYANPFNTPTLEEVSSIIHKPNYVSLESALSLWGVLSQMPQILTCVTTNATYSLKTVLGSIEYRNIKPSLFFGFTKKNGYYLASAEKAILDYIYLNSALIKKGALHFDEWNLDSVNVKLLQSLAKKYNHPMTAQTITFLLSSRA